MIQSSVYLHYWSHRETILVVSPQFEACWLTAVISRVVRGQSKVDIRWLSLHNCVNHIIEHYQPLLSYFDSTESVSLSEERAKAKAKKIRDQLKLLITKWYLLALSNILSSINKFNTLLQSTSPTLQRWLKEMNQLEVYTSFSHTFCI